MVVIDTYSSFGFQFGFEWPPETVENQPLPGSADLQNKKPSPPSNPRVRLLHLAFNLHAFGARENPSFCTMYSLTPSTPAARFRRAPSAPAKLPPFPGWPATSGRKNFSPLNIFRERAPRNPPSILFRYQWSAKRPPMAPDSAFTVSLASRYTRTIGKAPDKEFHTSSPAPFANCQPHLCDRFVECPRS